LANHESALKRHRQSLKRRDRNRAVKTRIKNVVKDVREALESNDKDQAAAALKLAAATLDKAAKLEGRNMSIFLSPKAGK
jgi:small subunit ribosomal protein S20